MQFQVIVPHYHSTAPKNQMKRREILYCLLLGIYCSHAQVSVPLFQTGFNFYANMEVSQGNGTNITFYKTAIIDTGNGMFTMVNSSEFYSFSNPNYVSSPTADCLQLGEDNTNIYYNGIYKVESGDPGFNSCTLESDQFAVGNGVNESSSVTTYFTVANTLYIDNPKLHNWTAISGDLGLSYSIYTGQPPTAFELLLLNATEGIRGKSSFADYGSLTGSSLLNSTDPVIFGLDINVITDNSASLSSSESSLQLGYVDEKFADSMVWYEQATIQPTVHSFFLTDLSVCGTNIMGDWGSNWPVLVDSGQVCLLLPNEFYNYLLGWVNTTGDVQDAADLPALSFKMFSNDGVSSDDDDSSSSTTFYVPLENLVMDYTVFDSEDPPNITIGGVGKSLCVLRSGSISQGQFDTSYYTPWIVLGTLALRSLYMAADMAAGSVGLANKLNSTQLARYQGDSSSAYCSAPTSCIGQQNYEIYSNKCHEPSCGNFFFTQVDASTQTCTYSSALGWGLFIIVMIAAMEISSFFSIQQTTVEFYRSHFGTLEQSDRVLPMEMEVENGNPNGPPVHAMHEFKPDFVTRVLGPLITKAMDFLVVYILKWSGGPQVHSRQA